MKKLIIASLILLFAAPAFAADVRLSWTMPDDDRVSGVEVYHGQTNPPTASNGGTVQDAGMNNSILLTGFAEGQTYYFAAKSYDADGNKSVFSDIIEYTIPSAPVTRTVESIGTVKSFSIDVIFE